MSKETLEWLNTQTLIGFTAKRGNAWHYRENLQGAEPNHYVGAIPVEDVVRRLFNFQAIETPVYTKINGCFVQIPGKKAITANDNGDVFGIFAEGYAPHQYEEWLVEGLSSIIDGDLGIGSSLLLRNRGVAVVQIEVPDNFTTPEGVEYRPNILAATSFNGTLQTTYKRTITVAVCDNTTEQGLSEDGQQFKLKHSKYSTLKLGEAREALQLIFDAGTEFEAELTKLCNTEVSDQVWSQVLDALVPVPEKEGRGRTIAEKKRDTIVGLWKNDDRVNPWIHTGFGVVQAFNTYDQHFSGGSRHEVERNYDNALTGKIAAFDANVVKTLSLILDNKELISA